MRLLNTIRALFRIRRAVGGEVRPRPAGHDVMGPHTFAVGGEITGSGPILYDADGNRVPEGSDLFSPPIFSCASFIARICEDREAP